MGKKRQGNCGVQPVLEIRPLSKASEDNLCLVLNWCTKPQMDSYYRIKALQLVCLRLNNDFDVKNQSPLSFKSS